MKIKVVSLIVVLVLFSMTACNSNNAPISVKDGSYVLEQSGAEEYTFPSVTINDDVISFSYDKASSYLSIGTFTLDDDILTMATDDGRYKYLFKVDGEKLIFQEKGSSEMNVTNMGTKVIDKAEFKMKENK